MANLNLDLQINKEVCLYVLQKKCFFFFPDTTLKGINHCGIKIKKKTKNVLFYI